MAAIIEPQVGKFEFKITPKGKTFSLPKFSNLPMDFVDRVVETVDVDSDLADTMALKLYADFIREQCPGIEKYNLTIYMVSQIVNAWQEDAGITAGELQASSSS